MLFSLLATISATNTYAAGNDWEFSIIPFFWAVNVNTDIEVGVPAEGIPNQLLHISEDYKSILKHVSNGGMLDINAKKNKFGLFINAMYVKLESLNVTTSDGFELNVNSKFGIYSAGAFYRIYEDKPNDRSRFALEPYAGARYTNNKSSAILIEAPEYGSSYSAHWTEPFIGLAIVFDINKQWSINLAGDAGVFKNNQDSYNLIGLIGYKPINHINLYLGYRQFYQYFVEGSGENFYEWKMHLNGPIVGVAFVF